MIVFKFIECGRILNAMRYPWALSGVNAEKVCENRKFGSNLYLISEFLIALALFCGTLEFIRNLFIDGVTCVWF